MWLMEAVNLCEVFYGKFLASAVLLVAATGADRTNNRLLSAYQLSASCLDGAESP